MVEENLCFFHFVRFLFSASFFLLSVLFSLFLFFPLCSSPFFPFFVSFAALLPFFLDSVPFAVLLPFFSFPLPFFFFLTFFFCSFPLSRFAPPTFSSFLFLALFFLFPAFPLSFSFFLASFFCSFPLSRFALSPLFPFLPFSFSLSLSLVFFYVLFFAYKKLFTIVRKTSGNCLNRSKGVFMNIRTITPASWSPQKTCCLYTEVSRKSVLRRWIRYKAPLFQYFLWRGLGI